MLLNYTRFNLKPHLKGQFESTYVDFSPDLRNQLKTESKRLVRS